MFSTVFVQIIVLRLVSSVIIIINFFSARVFRLYTSDQYNYGQHYFRVGSQTSATFQVQACNDAHVGLFDNYLTQEAYEIVIGGGGNKYCFLRRARLIENKVSVNVSYYSEVIHF